MDQLEGPNSTEPGKEEERVACPNCGEIFEEAGHKIVIRAFTTQQSAPTIEEATEKEYAITQEPASLNILTEVATKSGTEEPRDEIMPDGGDEYCTLSPECSHDTEIIEEELQQQGDEEASQDVVTQEPTSLEVVARTLEMQLEDNLEVDIIPDMHWSEDEQVQTQSLGDTEILEEWLHTEEDIQSQQQKDKEEQGSTPLEPVASQPLAETAADN